MEYTTAVAIVIVCVHVIGYIIYSIFAQKGLSDPNPASWVVWSFLALLNAAIHVQQGGAWLGSIQFLAGSIACMMSMLYMFAIGKLARLTPEEWAVVLLGGAAAIAWYVFRKAEVGTLLIIIAFAVSFYPTYTRVWHFPQKETALPWWLWTGAYTLTVCNLFALNIAAEEPVKLVVPMLFIPAHGMIAWLCRASRKKAFLKGAL